MSQPDPTTPPPAPSLADALVKQGGGRPFDGELDRLRRIVDADRRRVEALTRWTKRVWLFLAVLVVLAVVSIVVYLSLGQDPSSYRPNAPGSTWPRTLETIGMALAGVWLMAVFLGPVLVVVAVILTVLTYFARRATGLNEIRASLASLEAQVRLLASGRGENRP